MTDGTGTRDYHSPLRERQAAETRQSILRATSELVVSDGLGDFTMHAVAARAGVSERTVYHHFPNRQALLDGLTGWVSDQLRERRLQADPRDIDDLPGRVAAIFTAFEEIGDPARAMARLSAAQGTRSAEFHERSAAFRERFADVLDPLPADEAERCFAILRHLLSATTWLALSEQFDLSSADAARAVTWSIQTLLEDLRRRHT